MRMFIGKSEIHKFYCNKLYKTYQYLFFNKNWSIYKKCLDFLVLSDIATCCYFSVAINTYVEQVFSIALADWCKSAGRDNLPVMFDINLSKCIFLNIAIYTKYICPNTIAH